MNLQDSFLNQVRKDNADIKLVLMDGTELIGSVKGFDNFTVIVSASGTQHLVYKHAIAQIVSQRPIMRREDSRPPSDAPPKSSPKRDQQAERQDGKGEGFNTLDLSRVGSLGAGRNG